jgi:hypothetical protein
LDVIGINHRTARLRNNSLAWLAQASGGFRCPRDILFQIVVQSAEYIVLHHSDLISVLDQVFRVVARNLIGSVRLRDAGQLGG